MSKANKTNTKKTAKKTTKTYVRNFQVRQISNGYIVAPLSFDSWNGRYKPVVSKEKYAKDRDALATVVQSVI